MKTKEEIISISMENTKMGPIPSFSLMPVTTCAKGVKCTKGCYAIKMIRRFKATRNAWARNTAIVEKDIAGFVCQVHGWLSIYQPRAFRIHVGGDFVSEAYLTAWIVIAKANPKVKFFAFTKQFDILRAVIKYTKIPRNLSIILSAWMPDFGGWCPPADLMKKFPVAWVIKDQMQHKSILAFRKTIGRKNDLVACSGNCAECGKCFNLKRKDGDILFNKH